MTHNAATEIREDVGRRGGLGEDVGGVALAVELGKHKMTSSASLVHKVNIQVGMVGAFGAPPPPPWLGRPTKIIQNK